MYRCARCGEPNRNINNVGNQCERCGSKIFVKERTNVKKVLRSE